VLVVRTTWRAGARVVAVAGVGRGPVVGAGRRDDERTCRGSTGVVDRSPVGVVDGHRARAELGATATAAVIGEQRERDRTGGVARAAAQRGGVGKRDGAARAEAVRTVLRVRVARVGRDRRRPLVDLRVLVGSPAARGGGKVVALARVVGGPV